MSDTIVGAVIDDVLYYTVHYFRRRTGLTIPAIRNLVSAGNSRRLMKARWLQQLLFIEASEYYLYPFTPGRNKLIYHYDDNGMTLCEACTKEEPCTVIIDPAKLMPITDIKMPEIKTTSYSIREHLINLQKEMEKERVSCSEHLINLQREMEKERVSCSEHLIKETVSCSEHLIKETVSCSEHLKDLQKD